MSLPPPLPPPVLPYAAPQTQSGHSPVLDYEQTAAIRAARDAGFLLLCAAIMGLLGVALAIAMIDVLIFSWPSFGMALVAVPVGLVAGAFLLVAVTAVRAAVSPGRPSSPAIRAASRTKDKI